jgi:phosphatidylglycerophosphatase A
MPGTYGSALGVALYLGLAVLADRLPYPNLFLCLVTLAITVASIPVIAVALRRFTVEDPAQVVLDEVAGQMITLLPLAWVHLGAIPYWVAILAGFVLFRAFDVVKPYPIWKLGHLKGAWGVVADDLGAGIVAAILLTWLARFG